MDENYQDTLLYKNAKAAQQQLEHQTQLVETLRTDIERYRNELSLLQDETTKLRHQVDTMWVKWMGHGPTE